MLAVYNQERTIEIPPSSKSFYTLGGAYSNQRTPTDPFYNADITIQNAVIDSRYWIVQDNDHSLILATGIITSSSHVLTNIPAYGSPYLMLVRIRKSTPPGILYRTYETKIYHAAVGVSVYISQVKDE